MQLAVRLNRLPDEIRSLPVDDFENLLATLAMQDKAIKDSLK